MAKSLSKEDFIEMVKASGQEVIDRAEDLVGDIDTAVDFDIHLRFPIHEVPTIEVYRAHVSRKACEVMREAYMKK